MVNPDMRRVIEDREVVEGGIPIACRAIGRVPLRETIEGVLELDVADNHIVDFTDHEVSTNYARTRLSANDGGVRWDINHHALSLIRFGRVASSLQRSTRHAGASPHCRVIRLEVGGERVAASNIIRAG